MLHAIHWIKFGFSKIKIIVQHLTHRTQKSYFSEYLLFNHQVKSTLNRSFLLPKDNFCQ